MTNRRKAELPKSITKTYRERQWSIKSRTRLQLLMLRIHLFLQDNPEVRKSKLKRSIVALMVGAAFGLWRAAFLIPGADRGWQNVLKHAEAFLVEVVDTQTISYAFDQRMRDWTSGYYVNDARFRIADARDKLARILGKKYVARLKAFRDFKVVERTGGVDETDLVAMWNTLFVALEAAFVELEKAHGRASQALTAE
jgi:hypothetical protein